MRWSRTIFVLPLAAMAAVSACGDKIQPTGSTLIKDTPPPAPPAPAEDAAPIYQFDGAYGDAPYVKVDADLGACSMCTCDQGSSYCFAGASPRAPLDAGEGGTPACTVATSATPAVGCNALPAACAAAPSCACIIDTLQPMYQCYLNCKDDGSQFLVYCPN